MKPKTTGLGKGLSAIFDLEGASSRPQIQRTSKGGVEIELNRIVPNPTQPRTRFNEESLLELSQSIARLGVIQPITLREISEGRYMIISGERRFRASQLAGKESIPAYIRTDDDKSILELALVENIQREDLNAMEIAITLQRLVEECNLTQETLSEHIGKNRSTISNYIRLLKLPAEVQLSIEDGSISMGHARALLAIENQEMQLEMLSRIIKNHLSVRQTEEIIKHASTPKDATLEGNQTQEYPISYNHLMERLRGFMGENISIKRGAKGDGRIVIKFNSDHEVEEILSNIEKFTR